MATKAQLQDYIKRQKAYISELEQDRIRMRKLSEENLFLRQGLLDTSYDNPPVKKGSLGWVYVLGVLSGAFVAFVLTYILMF